MNGQSRASARATARMTRADERRHHHRQHAGLEQVRASAVSRPAEQQGAAMARATREDPPQDALHAARHRPSSAMRRPTTRSTTAIRTLSDRVATRSEMPRPQQAAGQGPQGDGGGERQHDVAAAVIEEGGGGGR